MKLFVYGAWSDNPDEWRWGGQTIIYANTKEEAASLVRAKQEDIREVLTDKPRVITTIPCYGDD